MAEPHTVRFAATALVFASLVAVGCAGSERSSVLPQRRQPAPLRSAADGEIVGANRQAPDDTLEASLTNEHPPPGWVLQDGKLVRSTEEQSPGNRAQEPKSAEQRKKERECIADSKQRDASKKATQATADGGEAAPAPRALERNLDSECPPPPTEP